jgi:hypothetical protein
MHSARTSSRAEVVAAWAGMTSAEPTISAVVNRAIRKTLPFPGADGVDLDMGSRASECYGGVGTRLRRLTNH